MKNFKRGEYNKMKEMFGAPFSKVFYTSGEITDVDINKAMATVSFCDKDGNCKTANFKTNELIYTTGETVSVQLVGESVFIFKSSGNPLFPP
ncbi:MAG: hypothetical protein NC452_13710 [Eubacterium sp.]|nr:hypothetical protein [Eubacterium sp.]